MALTSGVIRALRQKATFGNEQEQSSPGSLQRQMIKRIAKSESARDGRGFQTLLVIQPEAGVQRIQGSGVADGKLHSKNSQTRPRGETTSVLREARWTAAAIPGVLKAGDDFGPLDPGLA
ncbi:hypothetical protein CIHG_04873 [Coccidioides immitis H538.4]|uniref:Uncharacterized protein n=1 Tax=Coccidioides immitis H538.4 TaxID=396776 RepID=A0A0J8RSK6_COCIT|nr:hypothetical protein CIHG_04873 [Coccidioides immitis H538.4]